MESTIELKPHVVGSDGEVIQYEILLDGFRVGYVLAEYGPVNFINKPSCPYEIVEVVNEMLGGNPRWFSMSYD